MGLRLAEVLQGGAEVVDGRVLVGAEVIDHHHLGAGPVGAGEVTAVGRRRDQQRVVRDLDVIAYLGPGDAGRHQADRGRVAVVELQVVEHEAPAEEVIGGRGRAPRSVQHKKEDRYGSGGFYGFILHRRWWSGRR